MKKNLKRILRIMSLCLLLISISACGSQDNSDALRFKEIYDGLNDQSPVQLDINPENPIRFVDAEQTLELLQEGTGVIYFGFPECPWCRTAVPVLFDAASEAHLETIYYFNPQDFRDSDDPTFKQIMAILDPYLETNADGEKRLFVPDVFFIKEGQILANHLGTIPSQADPTVALTEEQRTELKNIYIQAMNKVIGE
jgi:thiol-disulfide isomerase/thioredoxin